MQDPGTIIGTRYKVLRLLGQGGMSNLYICQDIMMHNKVCAVKEFAALYADPKEQATALHHFQREGEMLKSLSHRNIPAYYDFFQDGGKYYLAMEYIQGQDLGKTIDQTNGPLPELDVADWGMQCAKVLYYLHCHKPDPIIFRDVKPSNIIVVQGVVKLIDFGIARLFDGAKRGDTMRIGSPGYAPPEQYQGRTDQRSDIFALGMTLRHALTGKDPTMDPNPFLLQKIPILTDNPNVSPELAAIVEKAIRLLPEERYQNMRDLKCDLSNFLESKCAGRGRTTPSLNPAVGAAALQPAAPPSAAPFAQTAQSAVQTAQVPAYPAHGRTVPSSQAPIPAQPQLSAQPQIPVKPAADAQAPAPAQTAPAQAKSAPSAPPAQKAPVPPKQPVIVPVPQKKSGTGSILGTAFKGSCLLASGVLLSVSLGILSPDLSFLMPSSGSSKLKALDAPAGIVLDVISKKDTPSEKSPKDVYLYSKDKVYVQNFLENSLKEQPDLQTAVLLENIKASEASYSAAIVKDTEPQDGILLGAAAAQKYIRNSGGIKGRLLKVNIISAASSADALGQLKTPARIDQKEIFEGINSSSVICVPKYAADLSKAISKIEIDTLDLSPESQKYSPISRTAESEKLKGRSISVSSEFLCSTLNSAGITASKVSDLSSAQSEIIMAAAEDLTKEYKIPSSAKLIIISPLQSSLKEVQKAYFKRDNTEIWVLLDPADLCPDAAGILNTGLFADKKYNLQTVSDAMETAQKLIDFMVKKSGQQMPEYSLFKSSGSAPAECTVLTIKSDGTVMRKYSSGR